MANFYEKGDKPLEIVTSRQWYIRNGGRDAELREALVERGSEITWVPAYMQHRFDELGRRPQRRLADLPPAVLRRAVPGLVPAGRRGRARLRPPAAGREDRLPRRPVDGRPGRLHRGPARQARRVRRRPRRHGHLGDLLADAADRDRLGATRTCSAGLPDGPAPAGPRHHPHLAVLHRRPLAPRARRRAVVARRDLGLRRGPGPQEDEQVQGQRRSCRPRSWSATAPTRSAGGPPRPGRARTRPSTRRR